MSYFLLNFLLMLLFTKLQFSLVNTCHLGLIAHYVEGHSHATVVEGVSAFGWRAYLCLILIWLSEAASDLPSISVHSYLLHYQSPEEYRKEHRISSNKNKLIK